MPDTSMLCDAAVAKLQYDNQLASLGLQGTLWGAWAALAAIFLIALVQVLFNRFVIQGWAFAGMVGAIVVPVALYGAFIFNRAITISGESGKDKQSITVSSPVGSTATPDAPHKPAN
jgi:hypothetical protein